MISVSDGQVYTAFAVTLFAGLATVVGGGLVLFLKKPNFRLLAFGLAFAAGAMIYVSLTEIPLLDAICFTSTAVNDLMWM